MTIAKRRSLLTPEKAPPSAEEVAARPQLLEQMLLKVIELINEHDLEMAVVVGLTPKGEPRIYHTYGKDLGMLEVAHLFGDLSTLARKEARKK